MQLIHLERNEFIVQKYLKHASCRKAIAFCVDVQHCHDLVAAFNTRGICAKAVWGKMPLEERKQTLEDFKNNKITILTSCNVLTEGFDEPSINCILMARPTKSRVLYTQMVGRGLRINTDKTDCLVLDFADKYHDLRSVMTLKHTIPASIQITEDVNGVVKTEPAKPFKQPALAIRELSDKRFDILGSGAEKSSPEFDWVDLGGKEYSLPDDHNNEIIIKHIKGGYVADLYSVDGTISNLVEQPQAKENCIKICEQYARKNMKIFYTQKNGSWMRRAESQPPTYEQLKKLYSSGMRGRVTNRALAARLLREIKALERKRFRNRATEPLTIMQKLFLDKRGIPTKGMTKLEAMELIGKIKQEALMATSTEVPYSEIRNRSN